MIEEDLESGVISRRDIEIVRGNGARIYDASGKEFLDMGASYGVCNVGHCNDRVRESLMDQSSRLMFVSSSYDNPQRSRLMSRLIDLAPPGMGRVFLCNSGTEAVEAALKFAIHFTGKKRIIAAKRSFHGRTMGSLSTTWDPKHRNAMEGILLNVDFVKYGSIEDLDELLREDTAAVILEPVQGEGGVHVAPPGYLEAVLRSCRKKGALLIIDEVQTGMGRTGRLFASEHHGISPDMICLGKSLGGGLPMAAVLLSEGMGEMPRGLHGTTFGGGPMACAAANGVLDELLETDILENASKLGEYFLGSLHSMNSPLIREIRGQGLMVAVELKKRSGPYLTGLLERGIAAIPSGSTTIRFLPPLVVTRDDIDWTVSALSEVLDE